MKYLTTIVFLFLLLPWPALAQSGGSEDLRTLKKEIREAERRARLQQRLMQIQQQSMIPGQYMQQTQGVATPQAQQPAGATNQQQVQQVQELRVSAPWQGANVDPFNHLLDWGSIIDPGVCYVSRPPPGWAGGLHMAKVENKSAVPGRIFVDGMIVDVVKAKHAGWLPGAWIFMVRRAGEETAMRVTGLSPGDSCYMALPEKDENTARREGWAIDFQSMWPTSLPRIHIRGAPVGAPWTAFGTHSLNTTVLKYGRSARVTIKDRGYTAPFRVTFGTWQGLPEYRRPTGL